MRAMIFPVVAVVLALSAPAAGFERLEPVNEGGDTAPCVTEREFDVAPLDAPRLRVKRIFDTRGVRVEPSRMAPYALVELGGIRAPRKHREVRSYPVCPRPEDGVYGGEVLVEYDRSGRRDPAVVMHYDEWVDWSR